ncbi:insulinase family protein [Planctomicrobium sp.]|jgi:zinc protease|nr:insulinase family protein [Planctomicrobium sp.]MDB4742852.1 insulinase family protein [Planctomicrobium sp.]
MLRFGLFLTVAGIALGMSGLSHVEGAEEVTSVEGITEYKLDNGVKVLLFPDPSKPQVTVNMTVFVGSRHEGYGEAGMAHLLEHMLFKGTPDHPKIPKVLKEHGAEFNGTTWLDRTNYYETLPASEENLSFAIKLEADRLVNSYVKGEDLVSEMTVVRNEFERGENSPSRILGQKVMSAAYEWHNYGQSTIGNRADIEKVSIESLRRFYKKYYQPDNIMVIVAGAFDSEFALKEIEASFGIIPAPERELDATYTQEPAQDGERLVTLRRVGDVGLAAAMYHISSGAHPDYVAVDVLEHIMTSSPSGRLYEALVESKLAASVSGGAYAVHDPGVIRFMAEASPGVDPRDVLSKMLEITETVGEEGVTEEEVERAKRYWLKNWEMALADSSRLAVQLSEWASQGDWRLMFLYRDRLEAVTADDVNRVANKYLRQNNRTAGLFIPTEEAERVTVPETPELAEMIGDYKGREAVAMGEAFDVSPQNIEERTTRVTLPSGVKAVMLPKKTRGESVVLQLNLRYGDESTLKGMETATGLLPSLMTRGTKSLSRQELQDLLDSNKAKLSASGAAGLVSIDIETRREFLPTVLGVLKQILREPTLDAEELELIRNRRLSGYEQQLSDPTSLARIALSKAISKEYPYDDVRHVATVEEEIQKWKDVTRDQVVELYEDYLNGTNGELSVVGDFDIEEIQPIVEDILADWTSEIEFQRIPRSGDVEVSNKKIDILTPDKENATYLAGSVFPIKDSNADYNALMIGNYILGSSGLSSRLGDRVRQEEGLSYSVGSFMRASPIDKRTTLMVYAITNPDNMPKVVTAIREELELLLAEGVTAEELAAAKKGYLERQLVDRSDDKQLVNALANTAYLDRTMQFYSDQEQNIQALTEDAVKAAFNKRLNLDQYAVVAAGDLNRVSKTGSDEKEMKKESPMTSKSDAEFKTTESGLKYKILEAGDGNSPTAANTVVCHYKGWLDNGEEFDSSYKRNQPATFPLNGVIRGWTEGLQLVKEGGKIELEIPADLGYGDRGAPPVIPGGATLHFEIELIEVK